MNIIIFGATGKIGKELVKQALENDFQVTAVTRSVSKVDIQHPQLTIQEGNVLDYAFVEKVVEGHDAVFCAIGAGRKGHVRAEATKHILNAMEKFSIQRFICQTTLGVGDSNETLNFYWRHIMFGLLIRAVFKDHVLQEDYIKESNVAWTIVRPSAFTDEEGQGKYLHGFEPSQKGLEFKVAKADVAGFMLSQLHDDTYLYKTPGLSY